MGRVRTVEPVVVRRRLDRLASASPTALDEAPIDPAEPLDPPDPTDPSGSVEDPQLTPGVATPRWLEPVGWQDPPGSPAEDFSLTDLAEEGEDGGGQRDGVGHRLRALPPAAVALVAVGVLATLIAAYFALRAPDTVVPVVDFPASAGPTASRTPVGESAPPPSPSRIVVSVVGLVRRPGLVRMAAQSRVADAVAAAGGPKPGADLLSLNLARPLRDGDQVVIGLVEAPGRAGLRSTVIGVDGAPAVPTAAPQPGVPAGAAPAAGGKVDINTATAEQLDALPGVGPVTAKAIVDWRTAHGGFTSVDQLAEVDGIGPARLQRLRGLVTVGGG